MSSEFETLSRTFGFGLDEMQWFTLNAMKSAFAHFDQRLRLINGVIKPGYARLMAESEFATAAVPAR
jgi:adenosine deaminase